MKLWSDSWTNGDRIPTRYAAGKADGQGGATFSDNLNPHLAWSDLPAGTQSLVLICHDFDVPSKGDDVNQPGREVPADLDRVDFFHWVLVDLPPTPAAIAEGEFSRGFSARGKPGPAAPNGARHGLCRGRGAQQVAAVHGRQVLALQRQRQSGSLLTAAVVQWHVQLALDALADVPGRFAMAERENARRLQHRSQMPVSSKRWFSV